MRKINPSMREKHRYVLCEIICEKEINSNDARRIIFNSLKNFIGEYGLAKAGLQFVKLDNIGNGKVVLKVNNKMLDMLKASFCLADGSMVDSSMVGHREHNGIVIRSLLVAGSLGKIKSRLAKS